MKRYGMKELGNCIEWMVKHQFTCSLHTTHLSRQFPSQGTEIGKTASLSSISSRSKLGSRESRLEASCWQCQSPAGWKAATQAPLNISIEYNHWNCDQKVAKYLWNKKHIEFVIKGAKIPLKQEKTLNLWSNGGKIYLKNWNTKKHWICDQMVAKYLHPSGSTLRGGYHPDVTFAHLHSRVFFVCI